MLKLKFVIAMQCLVFKNDYLFINHVYIQKVWLTRVIIGNGEKLNWYRLVFHAFCSRKLLVKTRPNSDKLKPCRNSTCSKIWFSSD